MMEMERRNITKCVPTILKKQICNNNLYTIYIYMYVCMYVIHFNKLTNSVSLLELFSNINIVCKTENH